MASIISAGTTSGTSLNLSGDTSGVLQLATNGSTTAITVDTSQNVGIGTASPSVKLQVVGTDGTAGGTNTLLRLLGNIGGTNKSGGLFFRTLNSTTVGTERIAIIQSADVDNNNRVLALNSAGGNVLIGTTTDNASGGVLQVSNGITFPATQSASSDPNTLDDYEEGIWTPTFVSTGATFTHVVQAGRYTKIGNLVNASCYLGASVSGTTSNGVVVSGLPFTVSNTANYYPAATIGQIWQLDYPAGAIQLVSFSDPNTTNMILVFSTDNSTTTNVLASYFRTAGSQTFLMLNITYQV